MKADFDPHQHTYISQLELASVFNSNNLSRYFSSIIESIYITLENFDERKSQKVSKCGSLLSHRPVGMDLRGGEKGLQALSVMSARA